MVHTKAPRQEGGLRLFSSQGFRLIPRRHCERSAAIQSFPERALDCRVAALLAMTEIAQEVLPARFLLTKRTVLVIGRSTSSPCFPESRARNGTLGGCRKGRLRKWSVRMEAVSGMSLLTPVHTRPARLSVWKQAEPGAIPAAGSFRAFRYSGKAWGRQNERRSGAWMLWLSRS